MLFGSGPEACKRATIAVFWAVFASVAACALAGCELLGNIDTKVRPAEGAGGSAGAGGGPSCAPGQSFDSDGKNCGACGVDCGGTACHLGHCEATLIVSKGVVHFAVGATEVFWAEGKSGVSYKNKDGSGATKSIVGLGTGGPVMAIHVADPKLYWTDDDGTQVGSQIHSSNTDGSGFKTYAGSYAHVALFQVTSDAIVIAGGEWGASSYILRLPVNGAASSFLRTVSGVTAMTGLAQDYGGGVFFSDGLTNEVGHYFAGGSMETIDSTTDAPGVLISAGKDLYWGAGLDMTGDTRVVLRSEATPTLSTVVGKTPHRVLGLAASDRFVYFSASDHQGMSPGVVGRFERGGQDQTFEPLIEGGDPGEIVFDRPWLYVGTNQGIVRMAVEP